MNDYPIPEWKHTSADPMPDCLNCITLAICKSHLSTATCYDEAMCAVDDLTKKCSLLHNYATKRTVLNPTTNQELTFYRLDENRAVTIFKVIIPKKETKVKVMQ